MGVIAYVGLGSNLGDRRALIARALERLQPRRVSTIVETEPWGVTGQPRFLNAVAEIETELAPGTLLDRLLDLERDLGRVRTERWGPRTMDLDLLLFGDRQVHTPSLTLPHPRLHERLFVLEGLAELCPELRVPGLDRTVVELLDACPERSRGACRGIVP